MKRNAKTVFMLPSRRRTLCLHRRSNSRFYSHSTLNPSRPVEFPYILSQEKEQQTSGWRVVKVQGVATSLHEGPKPNVKLRRLPNCIPLQFCRRSYKILSPLSNKLIRWGKRRGQTFASRRKSVSAELVGYPP